MEQSANDNKDPFVKQMAPAVRRWVSGGMHSVPPRSGKES
jgi:hypothetical protein